MPPYSHSQELDGTTLGALRFETYGADNGDVEQQYEYYHGETANDGRQPEPGDVFGLLLLHLGQCPVLRHGVFLGRCFLPRHELGQRVPMRRFVVVSQRQIRLPDGIKYCFPLGFLSQELAPTRRPVGWVVLGGLRQGLGGAHEGLRFFVLHDR